MNTPSPAGQPGGPPKALPRRATANPLVSRKRPVVKPQQTSRPQPLAANAPRNGTNGPPGANGANSQIQGLQQTRPVQPPAVKVEDEQFVDIPVYTTRREILEGMRHHVMRFLPNGSAQTRNVDIASTSQFSRPVKLSRRDPRTPAEKKWREEGEPLEESKSKVIDAQERERIEAQRAERRAEREANQAQIAPVAKSAQQSKKNAFQKKTEQVFQVNEDKANKVKDQTLRYEEALPWQVEDFDARNIWAGVYEGALSDSHIMLLQESDGQGGTSFRMVPLEKWYKFTPKSRFKPLSIDEAEARMTKRVKEPRWFMETQKAAAEAQKEEATRQAGRKLFARAGERGERGGKVNNEGVAADIDDLDYNYEEAFADDEENALFEGGEDETKEAEEKTKRNQREANIFEVKEQKDFDKEEEDEKKKQQEEKKLAKKTRKALMKQEKNYAYEDDSEDNPYTSESDSSDSEAERLRAEETKKAEEALVASTDKSKAPSSSSQPDASTSSTTKPQSVPGTPSKPSKTSDPLRKGILKRPGSPNLSEASGSESSRVKKTKKKHTTALASDVGVGSTISRPSSPIGANGGGAGSDAEMSDASKATKKLKIRLGGAGSASSHATSRPATPSASRPGSPAPGSAPTSAAGGVGGALPSKEEILALIPEKGLPLSELVKVFPAGWVRNPLFLSKMKEFARWDKGTKTFYVRT